MKSLTKKIFITLITGIIILVFGVWGMGDMFSYGNKNVIAEVGKKKIYINEYINITRTYIRKNNKSQLTDQDHSIILNELISQKIYEKFAEDLKIIINDEALANFIKNDDNFKDNNGVFSRTEYEKYLLLNNLNTSTVEDFYKKELTKKIIIEVFINGIPDTKYHTSQLQKEFLKQVEVEYYKLIKNFEINEADIKSYFDKNKLKFSLGEMRDGKFVKLSFENLGYQNENDQFYKTLNNIENDIINNLNFEDIIKKYKLKFETIEKINTSGYDKNREVSNNNGFAKPLFSLNKNFNTEIFELNKTKYLLNLNNIYAKNEVNLNKTIREEIIKNITFEKNKDLSQKITKNNNEFYDFAKTNNIKINKIFFKNILDNNKLFNPRNMEIIFSKKINEVLNINQDDSVFMLKISKISENKNKIDNLNKILKNQVKQEFKSLILRDLDSYLIKKYPIQINDKVLNQVKKSI